MRLEPLKIAHRVYVREVLQRRRHSKCASLEATRAPFATLRKKVDCLSGQDRWNADVVGGLGYDDAVWVGLMR
ncbi:hypothetical protein [Celeribacter sp.]|uniref:hypothetical protein n=1 Tax=Celeribacter sp. TaxID=1890673 RepID=UPI003A947A90